MQGRQRLSTHQKAALRRLVRGPLKYTVAGYTAATQSNADMGLGYVRPQVMDALVRRGFAKVSEVYGRRNRRAYITTAGRHAEARR